MSKMEAGRGTHRKASATPDLAAWERIWVSAPSRVHASSQLLQSAALDPR